MSLFRDLVRVSLHILKLHQRAETLVFRLTFTTGLTILGSSGFLKLDMYLLLDLMIEQKVLFFGSGDVLMNLQSLENLGLVVEQVGDLDHSFFDIELVLQNRTNHLKFLTLLEEPLVGVPLLPLLVTAEHF